LSSFIFRSQFCRSNRRLEFQKRRQLFICSHNELPVAAVSFFTGIFLQVRGKNDCHDFRFFGSSVSGSVDFIPRAGDVHASDKWVQVNNTHGWSLSYPASWEAYVMQAPDAIADPIHYTNQIPTWSEGHRGVSV